MLTKKFSDKTLLVGAFNTVGKADRAVSELRSAGFTEEEIGIVCSEKCREQFFADVHETKLEPEASAGPVVATGTAIGGAIGGLALTATSLVTGTLPLLAAGTVLLGGGALAGTFAGIMASLGHDKKSVRQCEQLVEEGKILVAVREVPPKETSRLSEAQRLMEEAGVSELIWIPDKV